MIYTYEGNTYTADALRVKLRSEYRNIGIGVWDKAEINDLIAGTEQNGLSRVTKTYRKDLEAQRHVSATVEPKDEQLLKLWELGVPLDHCTYRWDTVFAYFQMGPTLIRYTIAPDGSHTTAIFNMATTEKPKHPNLRIVE